MVRNRKFRDIFHDAASTGRKRSAVTKENIQKVKARVTRYTQKDIACIFGISVGPALKILEKKRQKKKRGPWATVRSPAYLQMSCNSLPV